MTAESSTASDWQPGSDPAEGRTAQETALEDEPAFPEAEDGLSLDLTFELLKNHRRRVVLRYLADNPNTTLSTLAEHGAAQENDKRVQELSSAERKRVYISLYQCHLPKLDDAGVIDFDSDRGTVVRNPRAGEITPYLDRIVDSVDPDGARAWHRYYLAIALVGGSALAVQFALLPTLVATSAVAGGLIVALAGVAAAHARHPSVAAA